MTAAVSARLLLTRHGQTTWHADNRYAGADSDIDLSDQGRLQAQQLADWVRVHRPDVVVSSPVRRARETAGASAAVLGLQLVVVPDLREVSFGAADGRTLAELAQHDAEMVRRFRSDPVRWPFPGAEPPREAADRAAAALRRLAREHADCTVLVVAHNTVLRLALCALLDLPIARYRQLFTRLDNAAITEVSAPLDPDRPASLLTLNVPVAPRPLSPSPS